jgi:hypothetical protein
MLASILNKRRKNICMEDNNDKTSVTLYLNKGVRKKIEDCFMDNRIKNFQEGYRTLIQLGYEQFQKNLKKGSKPNGN